MTNFESLKEHAIKTARNFALGVTVGTVLVTGAACDVEEESQAGVNNVSIGIIESEGSNSNREESEVSIDISREESDNTSNEASSEASDDNTSDFSDTSSEVSSENSDISNEVSDEISDTSSEVSDETSQEEPEEPTEAGLELFNYLEMAACACYGNEKGYTLEQVQEKFKDYELTRVKISNDNAALLDPEVNASVIEKKNFNGYKYPCYILRTIWEHPVLDSQYLAVYFPIFSENFAELCSILDIPSNDLAQFNYTSDEIKAFNEEESQMLTNLLQEALRYKGLYDLADEMDSTR